METAGRIRRLVGARNRELYFEATIELVLGVLFSALTFGFVYWITFLFGFFGLARNVGMTPAQLALLVMGIYLVVAGISAWRRVEPLAGLAPMTTRQAMLTMLSLSSPNMLYFSPRHATAGAATLLLGGPVNVLASIGTWRHRLRAGRATIDAAAALLRRCDPQLSAHEIETPEAALLLRRLALIKSATIGGQILVSPTEKGLEVLRAA